uniref:Cytochrome c oxidase subunit 3 n=1 Tax=Diplonema japonicum TaxID=2508216 RepID=A0A6G5ZTN5_9EUGL|nr:cytochrome c oxidase subunit 3 [Diplonema japonicum]
MLALRSVASHSHYVNVLVVSTMYVGTLAGVSLHTVVVSTTSTWDAGASAVLLVVLGSFLWIKENHYDEHNGVHTTNSSIALLASVVLLVVSEAALFISILWALVLVLVSHSVYISGSLHSLGYSVSDGGVEWVALVYQNTLTLLNTDLLLFSGCVSIAAVHSHTMHTPVAAALQLLLIVLLALVFLVVQCCEYLHLYWCVYSSGTAGVFYVITGIHGGHVLVGALLILGYTLQVHMWGAWSAYSLSSVHGVLSVILYWHFVDGVWITVVFLVYWGQLCM